MRVPLLPDERGHQGQGAVGGAFCRRVSAQRGYGYRIQGVIDAELVRELARTNGSKDDLVVR